MKIISLSDFIKNGNFGDIRLGDTKKDTFDKLNISKNNFDYFELNNLELQFNEEELVGIIFFINHCGVLFKNEKSMNFNILDLDYFENMTIEKFKNYCLINSLTITKEYLLSQDISIRLINEVNLVFEDNKLTSIAIMDYSRIW